MPDQETPRTPQAAILVLMAALFVFFAVVSRLGKPNDPTGIHRTLAPLLRMESPGGADADPTQTRNDPVRDLADANRKIIEGRGRTAMVIGSVRLSDGYHSDTPDLTAPAGLPPERPLAARAAAAEEPPAQSETPRSTAIERHPAILPVPSRAPTYADGGGDLGGDAGVRNGGGAWPPKLPGDDHRAGVDPRVGAVVSRPDPATFPREYTIRANDTLTSIAREQYGNASLFPHIKAANLWLGEALTNFKPGRTLLIPPPPSR